MKREAEAGAAARPAEGNALWRRLLMRMRADRRVELAVYGGVALLVVALYLLGGAGKGEPAAAQGEQRPPRRGSLRRRSWRSGSSRCSPASAAPGGWT